jgi:hypothetical protein
MSTVRDFTKISWKCNGDTVGNGTRRCYWTTAGHFGGRLLKENTKGKRPLNDYECILSSNFIYLHNVNVFLYTF